MSNTEKAKIYEIVEKAILAHASSAVVPGGTTEEDVWAAVREVMRDNPGIFWFSHQWTFDEKKCRILLRYTLSLDRTFKAYKSIDDVVTDDFFQGQKEAMMTWPEVTRVAYVYRWIAGYCQYNVYSAYNQTIYSVFVYRNSVCTGIAKATQYLLRQLNIESRLAFGRLHNSNTTSRHCWLIVKVDGRWYHHDPTFALPSLSNLLRHSGEDEIISDGKVVYNGFLTSTEAIQRTRTIEDTSTLPLCTRYVSENVPLDIGVVEIHRKPEKDSSYKGCLIASGSTADIYQHKAGYVVKEFHHDAGITLMEYEREIMSRLKGCKHLLQMDDTDNKSNGIVIELATPLTDLLQCHYYQLTAQGLCLLLKDVVEGIMECRERGIIYRDIHPANIYLAADGNYKLGDFGSCYIQGQSPCDEGGLASKWFMAPETYKKGIFDERSQVYMVAMVAYYLLNNSKPPFWDSNREKALDVRMSGKFITRPSKLLKLLGPFVDTFSRFLCKSLSFDSVNRYDSLENMLQALGKVIFMTGSLGDNPVLIDDGSYDQIPKFKTNHVKPDFCSTCESNRNVLVSNGEEPVPIFTSDEPETIDDIFIDGSLGDSDLPDNDDSFCTTDIPFCTTARHGKAGVGRSPQDEMAPVLPCPAPPPKSTYPEDNGYTYEPVIPKATMQEYTCTQMPTSIDKGACASRPNPFSLFSRLFQRKKKEDSCNNVVIHNDEVYSSVFAPAEVKKGTNILVQVFLHTAKHEERVQSIASQADKNAERRGYIPLSCKMKKGDKADVELNIYDKGLIKNERKIIIWNGEYTQCSFRHFIDKNIVADNLYCEINIYVNGVPVGCSLFLTDIVAHGARNIYAKPDATRFEKIFVSYSHQDYDRVKYLVQGFRAQGIDYFFDRHNLRSGDVYSERIFEYIDKADLFMLCWSANARKSEYVKKEIERALSHVYPQVARESETLKIRPISIEPRADFPPSMRDIYHFEEL